MFYCFDERINADGFRGRYILFNGATLVSASPGRQAPPPWSKPALRGEVSLLYKFIAPSPPSLSLSSSPTRFSEFPKSILRFDTHPHSDDNCSYVILWEG